MNTTQSTDKSCGTDGHMSPHATQRQNVSQESKNGDMNRERILEMARTAGMVRTHPGMAQEVLAFAALVARAEREACAKACDDIAADRWALYKGRDPYTGKEPERYSSTTQGESDGAELCADAIRARGAA